MALAHAGQRALMARFGLEELDIPANPDLVIDELDGSDDEAIEATLQITGTAFQWPKEQVDNERDSWFAEVKKEGTGAAISLV